MSETLDRSLSMVRRPWITGATIVTPQKLWVSSLREVKGLARWGRHIQAMYHAVGFEIGNHPRDHLGITDANVPRLAEQLDAIAKRCEAHKIPVPTSFAWPGNETSLKAFSVLKQQVQIQKK